MDKSTSIHTMVLSLRYLSAIFKKMELFVVALRSLNKARKLCTIYKMTITPTFVENIYPKKRKKIKKQLKKMECSYCGKNGKLFCCTSCMSQLYCSKSCQKRDWKDEHRNSCTKGNNNSI